MTKAFLEKRCATLRDSLAKAEANVYALRGALQDCEYLLENFDTPAEEAPSLANGADKEAHA